MIHKCCVVCTDGDGCVRSVDAFTSDKCADLFIAEDASKIYEKLLDIADSSIEVRPGYAKVFGEGILEWKRYPLIVHA